MHIKRHLTKHTEEHGKIKSEVTGKPEGNLVLLHDHPEGHNKIQDRYKSKEYVVVGRHPKQNVYCTKLVNGNGPVWTVN